jgi:hypothetical protein
VGRMDQVWTERPSSATAVDARVGRGRTCRTSRSGRTDVQGRRCRVRCDQRTLHRWIRRVRCGIGLDHAVGTYERYSCSASPRTLSYERYAQISAAAARGRRRAARAIASTLCDPCWLAATGDHVLACERRSHSLKSMLPRRASPNGTSDRSSTRPPKYRASGSLTTVRGSPIAFR